MPSGAGCSEAGLSLSLEYRAPKDHINIRILQDKLKRDISLSEVS